MASESTEDESVTLSLPAGLDDWLEDRARQLDVDRETLLVQLLASYRAVAEGDAGPEEFPVADRETVSEAVEAEVRREVRPAVAEATDAVREQLDGRIDDIREECREDLEDVRSRVVQVKKETDGKAPRDHGHEELERVADLAERVADLEAAVEESDLPGADGENAVRDPAERLDELEGRLRTVAWAVSDIRDARETSDGDAVERIKRSAARADVDRARCEHCGTGVDIALLTDPECPHCGTTVTDVEAASGFFGKPRLRVASQLEPGERE
jgi:hypothetical protein